MGDSDLLRWRRVRGAVALALAGALWSALAARGCAACDGAAAHGGLLAWLGVAWYTLLLAACQANRPALAVLIPASAGVHTALLGLLIVRHSACPPCLFTAAAAFTAGGLLLAERASRRTNAAAWAGAAAASLLVIVVTGAARPSTPQDPPETDPARIVARTAARAVLRGYRYRPGDAPLVVVFTMDGCWRCREFEAGPLADVQRQRSGGFAVQHRLPPKGMHVPVVVVLGAERFLFFDPPDAPSLGQALDRAAGGTGLPPSAAARL